MPSRPWSGKALFRSAGPGRRTHRRRGRLGAASQPPRPPAHVLGPDRRRPEMSTESTDLDDLGGLAALPAAEASGFLTAVTEVASGTSPEAALPLLTLALSQVIV